MTQEEHYARVEALYGERANLIREIREGLREWAERGINLEPYGDDGMNFWHLLAYEVNGVKEEYGDKVATLKRSGPRIPEKTRRKVYARDNYTCQECKAYFGPPPWSKGKYLTIDHIIAWSDGGSSCQENLRSLCRACNSVRGHRPVSEKFNALSTPDNP